MGIRNGWEFLARKNLLRTFTSLNDAIQHIEKKEANVKLFVDLLGSEYGVICKTKGDTNKAVDSISARHPLSIGRQITFVNDGAPTKEKEYTRINRLQTHQAQEDAVIHARKRLCDVIIRSTMHDVIKAVANGNNPRETIEQGCQCDIPLVAHFNRLLLYSMSPDLDDAFNSPDFSTALLKWVSLAMNFDTSISTIALEFDKVLRERMASFSRREKLPDLHHADKETFTHMLNHLQAVEENSWHPHGTWIDDLFKSLADNGYSVANAPGEADLHIARLCKLEPKVSVAVSNDCDLAIGYDTIMWTIRRRYDKGG